MVIGIEESYCGGDMETGTGSTRAEVLESEDSSTSIRKINLILVTQCTLINTCSFFSGNNTLYWLYLPSDMIVVVTLRDIRDNYSLYIGK